MQEAEMKRLVDCARDAINHIVYLHSTPARCRQCVAQRGNVDKDVQEDYLDDIDNLYVYALWWLMINHPSLPIRIIDWRAFGASSCLFSSLAVKSSLAFLDRSRSDHRALLAADSDSTHIVDADQLAALSERSDYALPAACSTVVVPFRCGLAPVRAAAFPRLPAAQRVVHSQAFKNLVNGALSRGRSVLFDCGGASAASAADVRAPTLLDFFYTVPACFFDKANNAADSSSSLQPAAASAQQPTKAEPIDAASTSEAKRSPLASPGKASRLGTLDRLPSSPTESKADSKAIDD